MSLRTLLLVLLALPLLAASALAADGDFVSAGGGLVFQPPQTFVLCDAATTNRTCTPFDTYTKVGKQLKQVTFSITGAVGTCTSAEVAINGTDNASGELHLLSTLTSSVTSIPTNAVGYRYWSLITSGVSGCTITVQGVFDAEK